jgi:hypothetical protein
VVIFLKVTSVRPIVAYLPVISPHLGRVVGLGPD